MGKETINTANPQAFLSIAIRTHTNKIPPIANKKDRTYVILGWLRIITENGIERTSEMIRIKINSFLFINRGKKLHCQGGVILSVTQSKSNTPNTAAGARLYIHPPNVAPGLKTIAFPIEYVNMAKKINWPIRLRDVLFIFCALGNNPYSSKQAFKNSVGVKTG